MTVTNPYCYVLSRVYPKQSFRVVFLFLALTTISCFIHNASGQLPTGNAKILGPNTAIVGQEIEISIELINPSQVNSYNVDIQYPKVVDYRSVSGANGNPTPNVSTEVIDEETNSRHFTADLPAGEFFSAGLLFTATFVTDVAGSHDFTIVEWQVDTGNVAGVVRVGDRKVTVRVSPVASGNLTFHRSGARPRFDVPTQFQLRLTDRTAAHHYSITIDPSENLGALTVTYDADDTNATAITNHTAGDPITVGANLGDTDSDGLFETDSTIVTLAFTPTAASTDVTEEGTLEITSAKLYGFGIDPTGVDATLPPTNPLTFTIAEAKGNVRLLNTGTGPTPTIKFYGASGRQHGPFDVDIDFKSENHVSYQINEDAGIGVQRGITGFGPEDIEISGTAEASLAGKLWGIHSTTGAIARINPTQTGTVEIYVPANVVTEIGTGLPNVASERFIVNVELDYPPWDVNEDGNVDQTDIDLVEAAIGQGLHGSIGRGGVWADSSIENERTDVDGDMYVTEADAKMVEDNLDEAGARENSEQIVQEQRALQQRSVLTLPDASVWMPDAKLRQCVRKKLSLADDTELTQVGMVNLSRFSCRNKGIRDITGLEYATNLNWLDLKGNDIVDLTPLEGLTKLTYLNIKDNQISNIAPLGNLTKLTELWMTSNNIQDISALSNLVELRILRISNNPILDLSPLYPLIRGKLKWYGGMDVPRYPPWDVNQDGSVDATDVALVTAALGQTGDNILSPRMDVNRDGTVDQDDLTLVTDNLDTDGGAPSSVGLFTLLDRETLESLDRVALAGYLNTLRAESNGSAKYTQAIAMLEHVLAANRPQETLLLANYPNPFNPETWIPYHLANMSDVKITIYDVHGHVIRRLDLGHQPAGRYTTQSRAAYWDGRNNIGESVTSGIYFYQLQADNISSLRKMLISK